MHSNKKATDEHKLTHAQGFRSGSYARKQFTVSLRRSLSGSMLLSAQLIICARSVELFADKECCL
jgi:hypothetical protein